MVAVVLFVHDVNIVVGNTTFDGGLLGHLKDRLAHNNH
jgi:hypothetical protein